MLAALILAAAAQTQPIRLIPVFAEPAEFLPALGNALRIGSLVASQEALPRLTRLGVTHFSAETNRIGPPTSSEGPYSWDGFDAQRKAISALGADWTLSIFTTFGGEPTQFAQNLSQQTSPAWSVWSDARLPWTANHYGALNRRFPKLPAVTVGIWGEFGDASFFTGTMSQQRWQTHQDGSPPSIGLWCGDPQAKAAWQRYLQSTYGSISGAFAAWGMEPSEESVPIPIGSSYTYAARLDFLEWYRGGIASLVSSLTDIADNVFKDSRVFVSVGPPHDHPYLGVDTYRIAAAAKGKADAIKVTNIGLFDFPTDWALSLARLRASAKASELPIVTEAAVSRSSTVQQRIFEAISLGSVAHTEFPQSILDLSGDLPRLLPDLQITNPRVDVAILYPSTAHLLSPPQPTPPLTLRGARELRDYVDFDMLEESTVSSGALNNYKTVVVFEGTIWKDRTLALLRDWVDAGGTLIAYDFGKMADVAGTTSIYQSLFGFASDLKPFVSQDRWIGPKATSYRIDLTGADAVEFLLGNWGPVTGGARGASNGAVVRLPVTSGENAVVTLRLASGEQKPMNVQVLTNNRMLAGFSIEGGLRQFSFAIDKSMITQDVILLQFSGIPSGASLPITSISVSDSESSTNLPLLTGRFETDIPKDAVKQMTRKYGKGACVFFPGKRDQWKGFLSVIRSVVFELSEMMEGKSNTLNLDNVADRIYVTDLGDRLAVYNANEFAIRRTFRVGQQLLDAELQPRTLKIVSSDQPAVHIIPASDFAEESSIENGMVRLAPNESLNLILSVPSAGRYKLYARSLRGGTLTPAVFHVGDDEARPQRPGLTLDTYFVGEFDLPEGQTQVSVESDGPLLFHFVALTNRPGIRGFRLAPPGN